MAFGEILTLEELEAKNIPYKKIYNPNYRGGYDWTGKPYAYITTNKLENLKEEKIIHLVINGVKVLETNNFYVKIDYTGYRDYLISYFGNGIFSYQDRSERTHIVINGIDKVVVEEPCYDFRFFKDNLYSYITNDGIFYLIINGSDFARYIYICKNIRTFLFCGIEDDIAYFYCEVKKDVVRIYLEDLLNDMLNGKNKWDRNFMK